MGCGCCRSRASTEKVFPEESDGKPKSSSTASAPEAHSHSHGSTKIPLDVVPGWQREEGQEVSQHLSPGESEVVAYSASSEVSPGAGSREEVMGGSASAPTNGLLGTGNHKDSRLSNHSISNRSGSVKHIRSQKTAQGHVDDLHTSAPVAVGKPFPKRPIGSKLSLHAYEKIETLFRQMDVDGSNAVTKQEADQFFKGGFAKLSSDAMFNEVDTDGSGAITAEEFVGFWSQVRSAGYKEEEITEVLDELIEGGTWVDWNDGRDTDHHKDKTFPKRPFLCRMSAKGWTKCEALFKKIDGPGGELAITREKAMKHFSGSFKTLATDAMFNEIDVNHHGIITPKEWMAFWIQVRWSGYAEKDIMEEIESIMEGNPWVDWKDGRQT